MRFCYQNYQVQSLSPGLFAVYEMQGRNKSCINLCPSFREGLKLAIHRLVNKKANNPAQAQALFAKIRKDLLKVGA